MDRKGFLKILGIGVAAAVVVPKVLLTEVVKPKPIVAGEGLLYNINKAKARRKGFTFHTGEQGMREFHNALNKVYGETQDPFPLQVLTNNGIENTKYKWNI